MKKQIFILFLILVSFKAFSQENMVTISGGYSFANIEDTDIKGTGWRINGLYEFNPLGSKIAHGFSFGYISLIATEGVGSEKLKALFTQSLFTMLPKLCSGMKRSKHS